MEITLLATKFYIPPARPDLVLREQLLTRINEGQDCGHRLTLVSAPAGFGKTTLISEWVSRSQLPISWVTLDENDNEPLLFMYYFITALQQVDESIGAGLIDVLQSSQPPSIEAVMMTLVNEIAALTKRFIFVFDDYHLIESQTIQNGIAFLLDHMPEQMHLVLITRTDPPLPIAKLRGRGLITELRRSDLRFTREEVAVLLNRVMGLELSEEEVESLAYRTEGWIAGLQMAAIALQSRHPSRGELRANQVIQSLRTSDRYILDYLVEEVLQRQSEPVQRFLEHTSILDRLCGDLCDFILAKEDELGKRYPPGSKAALSQQIPSQEILEYLEKANLFLIPLDSAGIWYRYHRLFADLLRQRLQRYRPELYPQLHIKASEWFEDHGYDNAAIDHAIAGKDYRRAGYLIENIAEDALSRSEMSTLLNWLSALPDKTKRSRPILYLYHAWVLFLAGESLDQVVWMLDQVSQYDSDGLVSAEGNVVRASLAILTGKVDLSIELAEQALKMLAHERYFFRGLAIRSLGSAYELRGELSSAINYFEQAVRLDRSAGNIVGAIVGLTKLASLRSIQGRLHEARDLYQQALDWGVDRLGNKLPIAGRALIGLGEVLREWNDLDAAEAAIWEGILLVKRWTHIWAIGGYISLARVKQAKGDSTSAQKEIRTAERLAVEFASSEIDDQVVSLVHVGLWLKQGRLELARDWFNERDKRGGFPEGGVGEVLVGVPTSYNLKEMEQITRARLKVAQGQLRHALGLLEPLREAEQRLGRNGILIEVLVLQALIYNQLDDRELALQAIENALRLSYPENYLRIYLDEGFPMAQLLYEFVSQGGDQDLIAKLLNAFEREPIGFTPIVTNESHVILDSISIEPLSDREVEVLALIAQGLSNQEIANELYISLRTVKWHTSNIYQKLGVKNRTQAVNRSRKLGIIT